MAKRVELRRLTVVTTDKERHLFSGPDASAVYEKIKEANVIGLGMTEPVYLDDSYDEVMFNMMHIVSVHADPVITMHVIEDKEE